MIHSRPLQSIKQVILQSQNSKGIQPAFEAAVAESGKNIQQSRGRQYCGMIFKHALDAQKMLQNHFCNDFAAFSMTGEKLLRYAAGL